MSDIVNNEPTKKSKPSPKKVEEISEVEGQSKPSRQQMRQAERKVIAVRDRLLKDEKALRAMQVLYAKGFTADDYRVGVHILTYMIKRVKDEPIQTTGRDKPAVQVG